MSTESGKGGALVEKRAAGGGKLMDVSRIVIGGRGEKSILLALRENKDGCYLKIFNGPAKFTVPHSGFSSLNAMIDVALGKLKNIRASSVPNNKVNHVKDRAKRLYSSSLILEGRKFYIDLLENQRGIYLKFVQAASRTWIGVPVSLLKQFRDSLGEMELKAAKRRPVPEDKGASRFKRIQPREVHLSNGQTVVMKTVQHELHVGGKRLLFEPRISHSGSYLRIMDCTPATKTVINIPFVGISQVQAIFNDIANAGDPFNQLKTALTKKN